MGLDVFLGLVVLVAALRGWFRGFWSQSIRLAGAVGAVYAAGPIRDASLPFVSDHLASIEPDLLRRLVWWVSAVLGFVVMTGVATGFLGLARRRRSQQEGAPAHDGDQAAGAFLGAAKGALVALFLASGMEKYTLDYVDQGGWFGEQVKTSRGLDWTRRYHPADRIWNSAPVQEFVTLVRHQGIDPVAGDQRAKELPGAGMVPALDRRARQATRDVKRPKTLEVVPPKPDAAPSEVESLERELEEITRQLEHLETSPDGSR